MNRMTARIEQWMVLPTHTGYCLKGNVYDHPKLGTGMDVLTTELKTIDFINNKASTNNTDYALGKRFGEA